MALTVVCSVLVAIGISKAASSFSASMRGASAKNREAASPSAQEDLEKKGSPSTAEKLNAAVTTPEVAKTAARAAAHAAEVNAVLPEEHLSILFERMALSQPEKVAVREADGSVELTYGDLLTTARRGADALRAVGLRSGDLVGLMVGPSVKGTAGILSIVLGGGAYVPLDPKYPPEWMSRVIEGAQIRLVATAPTYSDKAKERAAWLTEAWPTVTAVQVELHRNTDSALAPINEAKLRALHSTGTEKTLNTVLFTSGSTGTPKGVPSYETGVLSLARYFTSAFPYAQQEAVINHITYGWNDHKYQFWHPLLHGKEIVVVPDTEALVRMIDSPPPNVHKLIAVPSILDAMFSVMEQRREQGGRADRSVPPAFLALVIATGEALTPQMVERYRALVPDGTIVSSFGLTETEGETSIAIYDPARPVNGQVAIGYPRSPFTYGIRSLESGEWISAPGMKGELYIASPLIVRYYTRPDGVCLADDSANARYSTPPAELYLQTSGADAPAAGAASLMYQTGDLVEWRVDGEMQHLGRCDDQVKVNGVRIELGHVTAGALKCKSVDSALAVATKDADGKTKIVIFVAPRVPTEPLMKELAIHLPGVYMPSTAIALVTLPTLPNGKIDRKKLQAIASKTLADATPLDSISRIMKGKDAGQMPGWYYVILHICFLGLYSIIAFHMLDIPKLSFWKGHKWKELWAAYDGIGCVFFASGYYDLVGSPPRNWMQIGRSISTVLAVYVLYHLIQSAIGHAKFSLADLWPVAALLVYRTICWPLRLISRMECFPSWTESAMTSALAIAAFVVVNACFFDHVAECLTPSIPYEPWPFALGFGSDAVVLFSQNRLLYYFLFYAAHPPLLDFFWSNAWLPPPAKLSTAAGVLSNVCEPYVFKRILFGAYLIGFVTLMCLPAFNPAAGIVGGDLMDSIFGPHVHLLLGPTIEFAMYHAFFVALLHLLPAKATPVSELGACAFVVFVVYTSWFENYLVKRPGQIMLRLANAPNVWPLELLGVLLLIFTVYVACAFSFGLSSPIALPSWACRSCFGRPLPDTISLPVLHFPCGPAAFLISWAVIIAIWLCLPLPANLS